MILLNAEKLYKSYTDKMLLEDVSLTVNQGDKIGIIGVNGTGKSTLLKILSGIEQSDKGIVTKATNAQISYLPQNPVFDNNSTILEHVLKGIDLTKYNKEHEAKTILSKLDVANFDDKIGTLSGGQKRRVAIAKALVNPSDILILDEPTNHIDNDMVVWLENYLSKYKGAIVMITHDRYFLDRITNKIVEIDKGKLYSYDTNYTGFLELKSQREEMAFASERKRQSILRNELQWLKRGVRARGTKSRSRIENIENLQDISAPTKDEAMKLSSISSRLGKQIIEIKNICKSFGDNELICDFSYNLLRDDRIGIVGNNGCGKSTLINIITDNLKADSGEVVKGQTVKIGYFSQQCDNMDPNQRVIDYIKDFGECVLTVDGKITASKLLENFMFSPTLQYSPIGTLSGGEKRRLYLIRVLIESPNILILDEPTNDLDIQTLAILEEFIENFDGAVIAVSHDRYFLDRTADKIFAFEGNGIINQYIGGYTDYITKYKKETPLVDVKKNTNGAKQYQKQVKQIKFSYNEKREYDEIDSVISNLENQISQTELELKNSMTDYVKLQELTEKKQQLEKELSEKMDRWVYLNDIAEQIENNKA